MDYKGGDDAGAPQVFSSPGSISIQDFPEKTVEERPVSFAEILKNPEIIKVNDYKSTKCKYWLKEPPYSKSESYRLHSQKIPDPYRTLENVEDDDVKAWVDYQQMLTARISNEYEESDLVASLKKNWIDNKPSYPGNFCSNELTFYLLDDDLTKSPDQSDRLGKYIYELKITGDNKGLYRTSLEALDEKVLIFDDTLFSFNTLYRIIINSCGSYVFCEFKEEQTDRPFIYDIENAEALNTKLYNFERFEGWHPFSKGFYTIYRTGSSDILFYHDLDKGTKHEVRTLSCNNAKSISHCFLNTSRIGESLMELEIEINSKFTNKKKRYVISNECPTELVELSTEYDRNVVRILGCKDGYFYALEHCNFSRYNIIKFPVFHSDSVEQDFMDVLISEIELEDSFSVSLYQDEIFTIQNEDLQSVIKIYGLTGKELYSYTFDTKSTINIYSHVNNEGVMELCVSNFLDPWVIYSFTIKSRQIKKIIEFESLAFFENIKVSEGFAVSKDGTQIPFTIIHNKDIQYNSANPTIINGYGGFGSTQTPRYDPFIIHWVQHGGVYVVAHTRGNGGWKTGWAEAGARNKQQNTFDDFIACAEHIISEKITNKEKLVSMGASYGGLMVIVCMQQRPDLYAGVISQIPVMDMLNLTMGNFDDDKTLWTEDFGTRELYQDFESLMSYSPLHNIKPKTAYPPILIMACGKDKIAHPGHALKFVATMQDICGKESVHLYYKPEGGHYDLYSYYDGDTLTDFYAYRAMCCFLERAIC
jgi:protease II